MDYNEYTWHKPSFDLFLKLWNRDHQRHATPIIHTKIGSWLQERWIRGEKRLLLLAFRASGKSSLVGLFLAWLLTRDPDLRILVLSAESTLATKMARNVRTIIERHCLTKSLIPTRKSSEWASDKFTVERRLTLRDPSVWSAGLCSNITGARADIIICDDVEVPNTCETSEAREALRERLNETEFILNPGGTLLYIGTPHCYETIYADTPRRELGEEDIFLKDYARLTVPVMDDEGNSAWPERFSREAIELQRSQTGPVKFAAQMMLQPVNLVEGRLDSGLLQRYEADLSARLVQGRPYLNIGPYKITSCAAWWDPAFGHAKGDASVLAVIFGDDNGNRFLHHVEYITLPEDGDEDEARAQCRIVAQVAERYHVPNIVVETNGIGGFLPSILRTVLADEKVACGVTNHYATRPKDVRILEGFDAVMAARALHVHARVYDTPFVREMNDWRPGLKSVRDDGLDAAAGALSVKPMRVRQSYHAQRQSWQASQKNAQTEFFV